MAFPAWDFDVLVGDVDPPEMVKRLTIIRGGETIFGPRDVPRGFYRSIDGEFDVAVPSLINNPDAATISICRRVGSTS